MSMILTHFILNTVDFSLAENLVVLVGNEIAFEQSIKYTFE